MISTDAFTYLMQTTLAVSVLIALVLLVRRPFARAFGAKAAYALWAIPLVRLVLPPLPADWTLFGWLAPASPPVAEPIHLTLTGPVTEPAFIDTPGLVWSAPTTEWAPGLIAPPVSEPGMGAVFADMLANSGPLMAGLWLVGAVGVFAMMVLRQTRTSGLVKAEGHEATPAVTDAAANISRTLGLRRRRPDVQTSLISSGPLVTGLVRPVVLLPEWFEADYTSEEQRLALTHEIMHVKRGDLWALAAAWIALSLQWFNPLAWMAMRAFRNDQEAACDADVLGLGKASPRAYGETLVKAVRISQPVAQPVHAASLPLNHALHERLSQMKSPLPTRRQRFTGSVLMASVGAVALIASACASSTAQTNDLAGGTDDVQVDVDVDGEREERRVFVFNGEGDDDIEIEIEEIERLAELGELEGLADLEGLRVFALNGEEDGAFSFTFDDDVEFGQNVFFSRGEGGEGPEGVAEFTEEIRRLAQDYEANAEEIEQLTEEFEARMEAWAEARASGVHTRVMKLHGDNMKRHADDMKRHAWAMKFGSGEGFSWTSDGEGVECDDGVTQRRVFVVQGDDDEQEHRTVSVSCGYAFGDLDIDIDTDNILEELRERGELSEERLAEIEERLRDVNIKVKRLRVEQGEDEE